MKIRLLFVIVTVFAFGFILLDEAHATVTTFAAVTYPKGVAVDQDGYVYVQSLSVLGDGGLFKFRPDGTLQARNSSLLGAVRLATDVVNHVIWALEKGGMLYVVNLDTLQVLPFLDMRSLPIPQGPVLNILTGDRVPLLMIDPKYGDIAVHHIDKDRFDLFITGLTSAGGIPFVLRLRFQGASLDQSDIVVASFSLPNPIIPPPLDT